LFAMRARKGWLHSEQIRVSPGFIWYGGIVRKLYLAPDKLMKLERDGSGEVQAFL
jgi:hypothetical protein